MSYEQREDGLYVDDVRVYAKISGGILHVMLRAIDRQTFINQALVTGLMVYENKGIDAVIDEETGDVIQDAVPPSGDIIPAAGITVTEIGPHVITPAVFDDEGNEVTPAVLDSRYHVNAWLGSEVVSRGNWEQWIVQWMAGTPGSANANEASIEAMGVELIDPLTVTTPHNVLL